VQKTTRRHLPSRLDEQRPVTFVGIVESVLVQRVPERVGILAVCEEPTARMPLCKTVHDMGSYMAFSSSGGHFDELYRQTLGAPIAGTSV
jgi:hypothetical protein